MVHRADAQRCVFEPLWPDGDRPWDDELRTIDGIPEDDDLVDLVIAALCRPTPAERPPPAAPHDPAVSDATRDCIRDSSGESQVGWYVRGQSWTQ